MADIPSYFVGFDLDSGAGNEYVLGVTLRGAVSGGSVASLTDPVALADNTSNPTVGGIATFGMVFDGATWDRLQGTSADGVLVNLGTNNDVTVSGTVTVDSELPAAAALSDTLGNPTAPSVGSHLMGYDRVNTDWTRIDGVIDGQATNAATAGFVLFADDGANYQKVLVDANGHLQVDVLTGGGSDTPTNPVTDGTDGTTPTNVAAGAEGNIDSVEAANKKLAQVTVWSSVAFRARLYTVDNAVESTNPFAVGGAPAHGSWVYEPPHRNYITLGSTAGLDAFRVEVKNLDDTQAADFYAVFHYED